MAQKPAKQEFQFAHIETYARVPAERQKGDRKRSCAEILGEAARTPGHCPHVSEPGQPEVVAGLHPTELLAQLDDLVKQRKVEGRKRNKLDVHVLAAAVYSWPEVVEYVDRQRFYQFVQDTLEFHRRNVGPIDSALIHWDETYPHLHIYTVSADARGLSPGYRARREAEAAGKSAGHQKAAYCMSMEKEWQDVFYAEVGAPNGLDRYGPKRQRLTRAEFREAKIARLEAGDRLRAVRDQAQAAEVETGRLRQLREAEEARVAAARAASAAEAERLAAVQAQAEAEDLRLRQLRAGAQGAEGRLAEARREAERAEARLAELRATADQLSTDLAALPELREQATQEGRRADLLDAAVGWIEYLGSSSYGGREIIAAAKAVRQGGAEADVALTTLIRSHREAIQRQQEEAAEAARQAQQELDSYSGPTL